MNPLLTYDCKDGVATITLDDGKANVLSLNMLAQINQALDRAQADNALVLLTGRVGLFCGGFDLAGFANVDGTRKMLRAGFELSARLLEYPKPVVIACSGHAIAMGVFLLMSGDYRIGAEGAFKIIANEVAIGLTLPRSAIEICRQRLAPAHFSRALINADLYNPADAVAAGFLDRTAPAAELMNDARAAAARLAKLNLPAHAATKQRLREPVLKALRAAIEADDQDFFAPAR